MQAQPEHAKRVDARVVCIDDEPSFSSVIADLDRAMAIVAPQETLGVTRTSPSLSLSATIADCGIPLSDGIPPTEHMSPITYELRGGDSTSQSSDSENPWQVLPVTTDDDDEAMIMPVGESRH